MKTFLITAFVILSTCVNTLANERLVLQMNDLHLQGQNIIKLKQELKQQHRIEIKNQELVKVVVFAKSKQGHGKISLVVGDDHSLREIVDGRPYDFHDNNIDTYSKIVLDNPSRDSKGVWQLALQGNIKIKRIALVLEERAPAPRARVVTLKEFRVSKFFESSEEIEVQGQRVKAIRLEAQTADVTITDARILFGNGEVQKIGELEGRLQEGRSKGHTIIAPNGRNIQAIRITAVSNNLKGSRATLKVEARILE